MRLLFVVRGEPDFERFVAIAAHLQGEELIFVAPDPGTVIGPTIHWALFKSLGLDCQKFDDSNVAAERKGIAAFLASVSPDVAIFDQFGPSCAHQIVKMRDSALDLGIPVCMVPHGVRVVDIREPPQATPRLGKVADVVFYTSAYHFARVGPVLQPLGLSLCDLGGSEARPHTFGPPQDLPESRDGDRGRSQQKRQPRFFWGSHRNASPGCPAESVAVA